MRIRDALIALGLLAGGMTASAQQLTLDVEALRTGPVGDAWQAVAFANTYTSAVPVCTYALPSDANPVGKVRVRNVSATGMEVRVQRWAQSGIVAAAPLHCVIVDEGVRTLPDGHVLEARRVVAPNTTGRASGNWNLNDFVNVTATFTQSFGTLVVLGEVMTANDPEPSAFTTRRSNSRNTAPISSNFYVGKHIGQINGTRATETLAVIATSPRSGTVNGVAYQFGRGADSGAGVGNNPPYTIPVSGDFDTAVMSQTAEDGGDGGWAVLYGADPVPPNGIRWAVEEEAVAGDLTRTHTTEETSFAVFRDAPAVIDASKDVDLTGTASGFALPGDEVDYTIDLTSTGNTAPDEESVFLVDPIPAQLTLFTGDIAGAGSGPVIFAESNSGLAFDPATDIGYATGTVAPTDFSACNAVPSGPYDPAIRFLCLRPGGRFKGGALETVAPQASFTFRMRIN